MAFLVDTSVLVRLANTSDAQYGAAVQAILELERRGELLKITAQNLIEFRNVATRPTQNNGLGLSVTSAEAKAANFEAAMPLLPDTQDIFPTWKAIVTSLGTIGKQVHDARLVAVCHVHGVKNILTFNVSHFVRLAKYAVGISVVDPVSVCQRDP